MKQKGMAIFAAAAVSAIVVLVLAMGGGKVGPGPKAGGLAPGGTDGRELPPGAVGRGEVLAQTVTEVFEAVGTLRPRTETRVEAQVPARIVQVLVNAGDRLEPGQTLIRLDDREYRSRLEQARQGLISAKAAMAQAGQGVSEARAGFAEAEAQYKRVRSLFETGAMTSRELEQAEAAYIQAEARLGRAGDGRAGAEAEVSRAGRRVEEAEIALGYTVIKAPEAAEVARRLADPGDMAGPGKALLVVQGAGSVRLEAFVREGLVGRVRQGRSLDVAVDALAVTVSGVVEEVQPSADPATRTFLVKVGLPSLAGAYPGMFGRLLVPSGERRAVMAPADAVRRVGQLETVTILEDGRWSTIYVAAGEPRGDRIEILSGLDGGETVALFGDGHVR